MIVVYHQRNGEQSVGGMVFGLLVFGLGIAPLAVVQESIIIGFVSASNTAGSMGRALAIGLVLGKFSSWAASVAAQPLENISPRAPFLVATSLSMMSFLGCFIYWAVEKWSLAPMLAASSGGEAGAGAVPHRVSKHEIKHIPRLDEVEAFSPAFWCYVPVCALAGSKSQKLTLAGAASLTDLLPGSQPGSPPSTCRQVCSERCTTCPSSRPPAQPV